MGYELIAGLMFASMMTMLLTGQRVFGAIGFVATAAALLLYGTSGGFEIAVQRQPSSLLGVVSAHHPAAVHLYGLHPLGIAAG